MALVTLSPLLVPPPAGVDVTDPESLSRGIHLFEPRHFVISWSPTCRWRGWRS
jgi:hypothetical protein